MCGIETRVSDIQVLEQSSQILCRLFDMKYGSANDQLFSNVVRKTRKEREQSGCVFLVGVVGAGDSRRIGTEKDVGPRWGRVASMAPATNGRGPPDFNFLLLPRTLCLYLSVRIHSPKSLFDPLSHSRRPSLSPLSWCLSPRYQQTQQHRGRSRHQRHR